jgi:hypothetical protein
LRLAQQAKASRDAAGALREQQIEAALADYFEAVSQADRVRADARRKADLLLDGAEQAVAEPLVAACDAVRRLRELTGSSSEVASLLGITVAAVRDLLAQPAEPGRTRAPGEHGQAEVTGHDR